MSTLSARMEALKAGLAAAVPATRTVSRSLKDFTSWGDAVLLTGVYTAVSKSEGDYARYTSDMEADGTHRIAIIGQLKVAEDADPSAVEDAEGVMIDEIKAFMRTPPADLGSMVLQGWNQSAQMEAPYGWVAFDVTLTEG